MGNKDEGRRPGEIHKSLVPLATWMKANKPDCKRIAVMPVDMMRLAKAQKRTLDRYTITKQGDGFAFDGFELYQKPNAVASASMRDDMQKFGTVGEEH